MIHLFAFFWIAYEAKSRRRVPRLHILHWRHSGNRQLIVFIRIFEIMYLKTWPRTIDKPRIISKKTKYGIILSFGLLVREGSFSVCESKGLQFRGGRIIVTCMCVWDTGPAFLKPILGTSHPGIILSSVKSKNTAQANWQAWPKKLKIWCKSGTLTSSELQF